jgi:hypothetical protein
MGMSTDRELLELAAKAAGIEHDGYRDSVALDHYDDRSGQAGMKLRPYGVWNPLVDDGDALRLAGHLGITVEQIQEENLVWAFKPRYERMGERKRSQERDIMPATRRAIVRVAAEIARAKG